MKTRVGVVGCGALASGTHLPNSQISENLELVVTCDISEEVAKSSMEQFGAQRCTTNWKEVVEADDIDMIVLATHTNLRGELICAALEKGKPVYTEKPLADSVEEMMEIYRTYLKTGVQVCVGHNRRSGPAMQEFKRLIDKAKSNGCDRLAALDRNTGIRKKIYEEDQMQLLIRVNDDIRTWKPWIFAYEEGSMHAEMVHFVDIAMWLTDSPPVEVYASGSYRGNFTQLIKFENGSQTTIYQSIVGNFDYPKELFEAYLNNVVVINDHHLEVKQRGMQNEKLCTKYPLEQGADLTDKRGMEAFFEVTDKIQEFVKEDKEPPYRFVFPGKGHMAQLEQFARAIKGEDENPCTLESAIAVTKVNLCLLQSARSGVPVKIMPQDWNLVGIKGGH
ncbi:MAG: Gfo/Idh/MocA family oxidoreductase [Planctomycetota bacterium]